MKFILFTLLAAASFMNLDSNRLQEPMLKLKPCPKSPNCVCTLETQKSKTMEPLSYSGSAEEVKKQLKGLIANYRNASLVEENGTYFHYEFVTKIGKFTDDVEFLIDTEKSLVHFRSASRKGYGDFGKNKRRMKKIQKEWGV